MLICSKINFISKLNNFVGHWIKNLNIVKENAIFSFVFIIYQKWLQPFVLNLKRIHQKRSKIHHLYQSNKIEIFKSVNLSGWSTYQRPLYHIFTIAGKTRHQTQSIYNLIGLFWRLWERKSYFFFNFLELNKIKKFQLFQMEYLWKV